MKWIKEQPEVGDLKGYGQPSIFSYTYLQSINPQNTLDTHPKSTSCLVTGVHRLKGLSGFNQRWQCLHLESAYFTMLWSFLKFFVIIQAENRSSFSRILMSKKYLKSKYFKIEYHITIFKNQMQILKRCTMNRCTPWTFSLSENIWVFG